jgi:predicted double-glycine peptidase
MQFKQWLLEGEIIPKKTIKATVMVNVPDVYQSHDYDCGPCCLRAIAKYFDVFPKDEEEFIKICGTSKKDGTHPNQLKKTAEKLGLEARFYTNLSIESLKTYIDQRRPVIVEIQAYGDPKKYKELKSGHFVIAIGYDKKNFYFEDPSLLHVRGYIPYAEFDSRWQEKETNGDYFYHDGLVVWKKNKEKRKITVLNKAEHID